MTLFPCTATAQDLYGARLVGRYGWLTPVASRHLTSTAHDHLGRGSVHAIDITAPYGSAIYPIAKGQIEYAGCSNAGGYGCWIIVNHQNGFRTYYAHMINGSIRVEHGQAVTVDTVLGQVGRTGMTSFGPHVHLEIHGPDGRIDPLSIWPRSAFKYQKLGNAESNVPVGAGGVLLVTGQPASAQGGQGGTWALWVFVIVSAVYCAYSPRRPLAKGIYHGAVLAGFCVALVTLPSLETPTASADQRYANTPMTWSTGGTWDTAYAITRRWEGNNYAPCVRDPVLTRFGVTQGTYNSYLASRGRAAQSVCTISQVEVKDIFYRRYWLASGADKLPARLAITHFDFAINAGVGAAAQALRASGGNARAYNNYRIDFYQSANLCHLYCKAWFNRVADIRKYSE